MNEDTYIVWYEDTHVVVCTDLSWLLALFFLSFVVTRRKDLEERARREVPLGDTALF